MRYHLTLIWRVVLLSIHVLIPAGGTGSRFSADLPKQFMLLQGRQVIAWSISVFLDHPEITCVWVVLSAQIAAPLRAPIEALQARYGARLRLLDCAGASRARSVANGLEAIAALHPDEDPWVLVHDAARPGLTAAMLAPLLIALDNEPTGAILALPVADTLKQAQPMEARIATTVPREGLWQAQTPQAFHLRLLREALRRAGDGPGDEAAAVEAMGFSPRLIEGHPENLKLTRPADGPLLAAVLAAREKICV